MARIRYEVHILIDGEEWPILESEDVDYVVDRIKRIAQSIEYIAANIPSPNRFIPIEGFRIDVTLLEGGE